MQIDTKIDPRWCEALLGMLEGDLNHNRVAEVKHMLRIGIDSIRKVRPDAPAATELSHILLPDIPDGSGGYIESPIDARGCLFSGTGRGDCEHFISLPGKSILGKHDGPDDTVDEYGRPNGWCEVCWLSQQLKYTHDELYLFADHHGGEKYADGVLTLVKNEAGKHLQHRVRRLRLRDWSSKNDKRISSFNGGEYTAHIIEAKKLNDNGRPVYVRFRGNPVIWTPDVDKAFQFCRRIDAERFMGRNDGTWAIAEHGFCDI